MGRAWSSERDMPSIVTETAGHGLPRPRHTGEAGPHRDVGQWARYWSIMASAHGSGVIDGRRTGGRRTESRRTDGRISVDTRTGPSARLQRRRAVSLLALTVVAPGTAQLAAGNRALGRFALRVLLGVLAFGALVGLLFLVGPLRCPHGAVPPLDPRPAGVGPLRLRRALGGAARGRAASRAASAGLPADPALARARDGPGPRAPGDAGLRRAERRAVRDTVSAVFASGQALDAADGRYNILLLGGDSGANRVGTRPDSIQLASVDADTGRAVLFGFSRETEHIRFGPDRSWQASCPTGGPAATSACSTASTPGPRTADQFPEGTADPGVLATTEAVEALSGLDVQYHVLVDLKGFSGLIDAVGAGHHRAEAHPDRR